MGYIIFASLLSLVLTLFLMPKYIVFLKNLDLNQETSVYSLEQFKTKTKTPIMGGAIFVMIPIIISLAMLFFKGITLREILVLSAFLGFGLIGFVDDFLIIIHKNNKGLRPKYKLIMQVILVLILSLGLKEIIDFKLNFYVFNFYLDLGYFYYPFLIFMFCAETNATNFTDGMDGLLAGCSIIVLSFLALYCFHQKDYNLLLILGSVIASLLGYLKFNFYPAKIFMGDSGSIALGGLITILFVILKHELLLLLMGFVFLWEMASVVLQILAVKTIGRRIFLYTPIHYSFVKRGWQEKNVVYLMWFITFVTCLLGYLVGLS